MKNVGSINRLNEEPISRDRLTSEHLGDGTDSNWGSEVDVPDNSCTPCVVPVLVVRSQLLKSSTLHDIHPVRHLHLACSVIRIRFVNEASPGSLRWVQVSGASCRINFKNTRSAKQIQDEQMSGFESSAFNVVCSLYQKKGF